MPSQIRQESRVIKPGLGKRSGKSGLFLGALVALIAVVVLVSFLLSKSNVPKVVGDDSEGRKELLPEQKPSAAPKNDETDRDQRVSPSTNKPVRATKVRQGSPLDPGYVSPDPTFSNRYERFKAEQAKVKFQKLSEFEIHRVIAAEPGETFLPYTLPAGFEEDFKKHMDDPIVINEDDPDDLKEAKRNMIEAKARIKELMKEGYTARQVLEKEQEALLKAQALRDNLMNELREIQKTSSSMKEVDDFVEAANTMLKSYGAKNIKMPMSPERFRLMKAEGLIKK